ncbi:hypothetical protein TDSAC_1302 [Thermodesulfobium acidiphilum]|uniref:Uncharacterized protein n=1 Tax=Thermodesulfobium acidiphilum TaxID=1794699 RepID=A0A2R4W1F1_THEAF|nr:hypothetical protein TDSAC_1302 [Thermodesulfobium acidiphilum]
MEILGIEIGNSESNRRLLNTTIKIQQLRPFSKTANKAYGYIRTGI